MRTFVTTLIVAALLTVASKSRMIAAENPIVPEGAKLELLFTRTAKLKRRTDRRSGRRARRQHLFHRHALRARAGHDPALRSGHAQDDGLHRRERQGQRADLRRQRRSRGLRRRRLRRPPRRRAGTSRSGKSTTIADNYQGKKFNAPNDLCIDTKGRIYFTDPRYLGEEPRELEHRAVYRIDTDGTVVEVTHDVEKPNGVALSPDEKTLYVGDHNNGTDRIDPTAPPPKTGAMKVLAFPLGADGLVNGQTAHARRLRRRKRLRRNLRRHQGQHLSHVPQPEAARPDGHRSAGQGAGLHRHRAGRIKRRGKEPVGLPSNCEFGIGGEDTMLYLTIDKSLYRIRLKVAGYHVPFKKQ